MNRVSNFTEMFSDARSSVNRSLSELDSLKKRVAKLEEEKKIRFQHNEVRIQRFNKAMAREQSSKAIVATHVNEMMNMYEKVYSDCVHTFY